MTAVCDVHLHRREVDEPWGFSITGGKDQYKPLVVTKVKRNSPAEGQLEEGEEILMIDETKAASLFHHHATGLIKNTGLYLKLTVNRAHMTPGARTATWSPRHTSVQNKTFTHVEAPSSIPVNRPQVHTITHHSPIVDLPRVRTDEPAYQFPALPPETSLAVRGATPSGASPSPTRCVTSRPGASSLGHQVPLTVFYSTPDVAFVGHPSASTRTVAVNLPLGSTVRGVSSVYPFRTPPRIDRPKKASSGPSIMLRM